MVPVLQCLTPPSTSQLTRPPAWPCPFVFAAQCSICPLGKLPGNTPITTSPHHCSEYSAAVSCISLIRSPHTHIKADRLLSLSLSLHLSLPLLSCPFFVGVCLACCTIIYDLYSHYLIFNSLPFCPSSAWKLTLLTICWSFCQLTD